MQYMLYWNSTVPDSKMVVKPQSISEPKAEHSSILSVIDNLKRGSEMLQIQKAK